MATVNEEAEFWANELRDLSPEVRYLLWKELEKPLKPDQFSRLRSVGDEEDALFECPHCNLNVDPSEIRVVASGLAVGEFDDWDAEEETLDAITPHIDEVRIAYECGECGAPVNIPSGWSVN